MIKKINSFIYIIYCVRFELKMMGKNGSYKLLNLHTDTIRAVRTAKSSDLKKRIENVAIREK